MSDLPDVSSLSSRRYTDTEVARIIKDASEMQKETTAAESSVGLSLTELEAIAREAGLDPAFVRRAAANIDTSVTGTTPSRFLGAPHTLILERTIDGEVPEEEYEAIALEIQRMLGGMGTTSSFGRTLQWTSAPIGRRRGSLRMVQVTVTPRNGRTTIRIEEPMRQVAAGIFAGGMGGIGIGMAPAVSLGAGSLAAMTITPAAGVAVAIGATAAFFGALYSAARYTYGRIVQSRSDKLQRVMSRLVDHVIATAKPTNG